jgi:diadenosine tetraphosphate (Ap4A) HIT family hydrolase
MQQPHWQAERDELMQKINALRQQSICYSCHHAATGEVFQNEAIVYEDAAFSVKLDPYPRTRGHTIVVYKPHREDISELNDAEAAALFQLCVRLVRALKQALGAEKVYMNTMCDGGINHLHVQLFPRYAGESIGSTRFVAPRSPLADGPELAKQIRDALILEALGQEERGGPSSSSSI